MSHTFSRDEINAILREAAQQQHAATPEPAEQGLTLEELQDVARASGIDPRFVQQAASKRMTRTGHAAPQRVRTGLTRPTHYSERVVPGRFDPAKFPLLFDHIRDVLGIEHEIGRSYARTDQLTWSKGPAWNVEVVPEADRTVVTLKGSKGGLRGLLYGAGGVLGLLLALMPNLLLENGALGGILGLIMFVATLAAFGMLWAQHARTWHRRMEVLEERLAGVIVSESDAAKAMVQESPTVREGGERLAIAPEVPEAEAAGQRTARRVKDQ